LRVREVLEVRFGDISGPPAGSFRVSLDAGPAGHPEAVASALKIVLEGGISTPVEHVGKGLELLHRPPDLGGHPVT